LLDALDRLASPSDQAEIEIPEIRNELKARRAHLHRELAADGLIGRLGDSLEQAQARIETWPVKSGGWKTLRRGILPVYRRGRRLMRRIGDATLEQPASDMLHEWRKQAKTLWYQVQVLEGIWPAAMEPLAAEIHQLTDLLGEDHDLVILHELIATHDASHASAEDRDRLLERIDTRRHELQKSAFQIGERLYAERPKAFTRRLGRYWRTRNTKTPDATAPVPSGNGVPHRPALTMVH
jgi:CHAD domain-containing protein